MQPMTSSRTPHAIQIRQCSHKALRAFNQRSRPRVHHAHGRRGRATPLLHWQQRAAGGEYWSL